MKKGMRRGLALVLTLSVALGLLWGSAWAAEIQDNEVLSGPVLMARSVKRKPTLTVKKAITKKMGAKAFQLKVKTNSKGKLTYQSSKKKVAVISKKGKVTLKGVGKTTLTVKVAANKRYKAATKKVTLTVQKGSQTIQAKSVTKTLGDKAFSLGAKASGGGKLSYQSSKPQVATVSKAGKVTLKGVGKTTLTVKASATANYKAAAKKVTVTVKAKPAVDPKKNLKAAQALYAVDSTRTITAKTPAKIQAALGKAGDQATSKKRYIVYAPAGKYAMGSKLTVPKNVIFVAEDGAKFTATTEDNFNQFFMVQGSLYGGNYDGKGLAYYCLRLENTAFTGVNGRITNATVKNSKRAGIVAIGTACKNGLIQNNTVTQCGNSGISVLGGAWVKKVSGNVCKSNTEAGVNLGHANVDVISGNTLTGNTGHGISTDTDGEGQEFCYVLKITGNTIQKNGKNGVYMDKNCRVSEGFSGNVISGNHINGLSLDQNSYVAGIVKNQFLNQVSSNLRVSGAGSSADIQKGNTFSGGGTNNVTVTAKGSVTLTGTGNLIEGAKSNGVSVSEKGTFLADGEKLTIRNNGVYGIRSDGTGAIKYTNITFSGNGAGDTNF